MPLVIPVAAVETLSEAELQTLKRTLIDYFRSSKRLGKNDLEGNLHLTRGEKIPAYDFTLQVLLESRSGKPENVVKPFTPDTPAPTPVEGFPPELPRGPVDLWQFPSEIRADYAPHEGTYFVPSSMQVKDCNECFQKGEVTCRQCFGKGEDACQTCLGGGTQACEYCKGAEKMTCLHCNGEGRLSGSAAAGKTIIKCDACAGSGKYSCTHCKGGKTSCGACLGTGQAPCRKCDGKKQISCPTCAGNKKILVGMAFKAEFKPHQVNGRALVAAGPREALDAALTKTAPVGTLMLEGGESFEKQVQEASLPASVKGALGGLADRLKPKLDPTTRPVKQRLLLAEGHVLRLSGYCAGQEFIFWMPEGGADVIIEKDPVASLANTVAVAAEEARNAGDWRKALSLARETLDFDPQHPAALALRQAWRVRVFKETLVISLGLGVLWSTVYAVHALYWQKGLHKAGALLQVTSVEIPIGLLAGLVLWPALLRLYERKIRWTTLAGTTLGVLVFFMALCRWGFDWNPVQTADGKALRREVNEHFKFGYPTVFVEKDLRFLQDLNYKYKDSMADLRDVKGALDRQLALKAERDRLDKEFERKLATTVLSGMSFSKKREMIEEYKNHYSLRGVDVSRVKQYLDQVAEQERKYNMSRNRRATPSPNDRIDIHWVGRGRRGPPPKKAPAKKPAAKAAPAKKTKK